MESEMDNANKASLFMTIPIEIQHQIVKKLKNYMDVENLCDAYPQVYEFELYDWYLEMKNVQITQQVFNILLQNKYLDSNDALKSRSVSKIWKQSVDHHYRTANIHSVTFVGGSTYQYPRAVIRVPTTTSFSTRLNDYANHGGNPFVGNRVMIKCGNNVAAVFPWRREKNLIQSEQVAHVWQHVEHLEICLDDEWDSDQDDADDNGRNDWRGCIGDLLRPFLKVTKNVKTLKLDWPDYPLEWYLIEMSALASLEQLVVSMDESCDDIDYREIFPVCQSSLKLLSGNGFLAGSLREREFTNLKFEQLEELCINGDYMGLDVYSKVWIAEKFPILKVVRVDFFGEMDFYKEFVSFTHAFKGLEHIVIKCVYNNYYPISDYVAKRNARCVRKGLKKLIIVNVRNEWRQKPFYKIVSNFYGLFKSDDEVQIVEVSEAQS